MSDRYTEDDDRHTEDNNHYGEDSQPESNGEVEKPNIDSSVSTDAKLVSKPTNKQPVTEAEKPDESIESIESNDPVLNGEAATDLEANNPDPELKGEGETSAPEVETSTAKAEASAAEVETSAAEVETSTSKAEASALKAESPAAEAETSAAAVETSAAEVETTSQDFKSMVKENVKEPPATETKDADKFARSIDDLEQPKGVSAGRLPTDSGFRFFFWSLWGYMAAAIILVGCGIAWIVVTKGTTFGAYSPLVFVAGGIILIISVLNIILLCYSPSKVFCHGVMAIVTFFVCVALVALAVVLGGFHLFTINLESAIFKIDFEHYEEKLKLDTPAKIKAVDDGYYWMAFAFGTGSAVIIIVVFVLSAISCCRYLRCHYFVPLFCGFMPMLVGVMGMVFSLSLASLSIMTRMRYSFIYNKQGWWIFFMGLVDLLLSFLLMGVFFGVTCKSDRNTIKTDATYPEDGGFDSIKSRSRVMGKDYWNCRFEFCLFMWLNVLVCTPVFVLIAMNVVINGQADHSYPLPCFDLYDTIDTTLLSSPITTTNSFTALINISAINSKSNAYSSDCIPEPLPDANCTGQGNPGWSEFADSCTEFRESAKRFKFGREGLSVSDYTVAACNSVSSSRGNSGRKSVFYGVTRFARRLVAHLGFTTGRAERERTPETEAETQTEIEAETAAETESATSDAPTSSFAPLNLIDTLMAQDPDELAVVQEQEAEGAVFDVLLLGTAVAHNDWSSNSSNNNARTLAPSSTAASSLSNGKVCYDFTDTVYGWKEDIESYGADMCVITGLAMLVPAVPILALDALLAAIVFAVLFAVMAWIGLVMSYYVFYIIVYYLCQREVVDDVQQDGNYIITYYHIEDHSPGFNCCICCGMNGCCIFIQGFTGCVIGLVLAFFLSDKICGCCEDEDPDDDADANSGSK